jgi:hypothetical protein
LSIPAPPDPRLRQPAVAAVIALFSQLHADLADVVTALDDAGCNWAPAEDTNTVAVLVTHLLGSERETMHAVAGRAPRVPRDRPLEFVPVVRSRRELLAQIDETDSCLGTEWGPAIDADPALLDRPHALPTLAEHERRPGITWLVANYGHAREHLGHVLLTAQLYREARARAGVSSGPARPCAAGR